MDLKLSQFRVFLAVAETGNILDAAERVGRSPSAVSIALKQLTEEIGAPLFVGDRKNALTDVGRHLLELATQQVTGHGRAMESLRAFVAGEIGTLEIAAVPSVATRILPPLLKNYVELWPGVRVDIRDMDSKAVAGAVAVGEVEIGVAGRPVLEGVDFAPLFKDRLLAIGFRDANGNPKEPVPIDRLPGPRLIANGIIESLGIAGQLLAQSRLTVRNTSSLLSIVREGVGYTILPRLALPVGFDKEVPVREIGTPPLEREVGILAIRGRELSRAAESFVPLLKTSADNFGGMEHA